MPLLILLPIKLFAVRRANRMMDAFFLEHAFRMRPIPAGGEQAGFVFTNLSEGNKIVLVRLLGPDGFQDFEFSVPVEGLRTDYLRREFDALHAADELTEVDMPGLRQYLAAAPPATTNRRGRRTGDPVNLVVVGDFPTVLGAFGARWDETEVISLATCWKTVRAFLTGAEYRYSPVSALFLFGRSQDFALQRIRSSINERLHLRLWATPLQFHGQARMDRAGQPRHRRPVHLADLESDDASDRSRRGRGPGLCRRGSDARRPIGDGRVRRWRRPVRPGDPAAELDRRSVLHRRQAGRRFPVESRTTPKFVALS